MQGLPNIILTCSYSYGRNYKKYFDYMTRKKALEEKKELTKAEQEEQNRVTEALRKQGYFTHVMDDRSLLSADGKDKEKKITDTHKLLTEDEFNQIYNEDYSKYLGYMVRRQAIASKKQLSKKDIEEMKRISGAMDKMGMPQSDPSKLLIDVWTNDKDTMTLGDRKEFQDKMDAAKKHGSMLWTDVVSFDNRWLERQGLYNPKTGELKSEALREASRKMLDVLGKKEQLNQPFWLASVHRNTDNIHIHFAIMEKENSRKMVDVGGEMQPRGNFKQSTIYAMKSAFANELVDLSRVQARITEERSNVREAVYQNAKEAMNRPDFRDRLNAFIKRLPADRRKWNYQSLHRMDPSLTKELDKITDELLKDDPHLEKYKDLVGDVDEFYKEQYGKTKNEHKHYADNQLKDLKKRAGNRLLHDLSNLQASRDQVLQRAAELEQKGISKIGKSKKKEKDDEEREKSKARKHFASTALKQRQLRHKQMMDYLQRKRQQEQKKAMQLTLRKRSIRSLQNGVQKEFDNGLTTYEKVQAMREFQRWHGVEQE